MSTTAWLWPYGQWGCVSCWYWNEGRGEAACVRCGYARPGPWYVLGRARLLACIGGVRVRRRKVT